MTACFYSTRQAWTRKHDGLRIIDTFPIRHFPHKPTECLCDPRECEELQNVNGI